MKNPFLTYGYAGADYFCDREAETQRLTTLLTNGNHVALMSPRRMGKTGLIRHCFAQPDIEAHYYTFLVDIYATKSLAELVYELGRTILTTLKSQGRQAWEAFVRTVASLRAGITMDETGRPVWSLEIGDIRQPAASLDEIFHFLASAKRPCLVAIDEFQSIAHYAEKNVEATLRTYIQRTPNAWFVFSGSQRTMMGEIFSSPARPFYQSATTLSLAPIALSAYDAFICHHFEQAHKQITHEAIAHLYQRFGGTTWYIQKVANELFATCDTVDTDDVDTAIHTIVEENTDTYKDTLYRLTSRQKAVLIALARAPEGTQPTSSTFLRQNRLPSASSVQKALTALLDKEMVTNHLGTYALYDRFLALYLLPH